MITCGIAWLVQFQLAWRASCALIKLDKNSWRTSFPSVFSLPWWKNQWLVTIWMKSSLLQIIMVERESSDFSEGFLYNVAFVFSSWSCWIYRNERIAIAKFGHRSRNFTWKSGHYSVRGDSYSEEIGVRRENIYRETVNWIPFDECLGIVRHLLSCS